MRNGWQAALLAGALALGGSAHAQGSASRGGQVDEKLQVAAQRLHASNQGEVAAGKAALQSAQSAEVKAFAQEMVDDHSKNDERLQGLAQTMSVALEGDEFQKKLKRGQEDLKKAQAKQGADFDKAYVKMMLKEHEQDVKEVERAAKGARKANQPELALFLENTRTHLRIHLHEAKRVERSLGGKRGGATSSAYGTTGGGGSGAKPGPHSGQGHGAPAGNNPGDDPTGSGPGGMAGDHGGAAARSGSAPGSEGGAGGTGGAGQAPDGAGSVGVPAGKISGSGGATGGVGNGASSGGATGRGK